MKIYVGHSNSFDYQKELYDPIKKSNIIIENDVFFPHNEKDLINRITQYLKTKI